MGEAVVAILDRVLPVGRKAGGVERVFAPFFARRRAPEEVTPDFRFQGHIDVRTGDGNLSIEVHLLARVLYP